MAATARQAKASLQNSLIQNIEKATTKVFLDILEIEVAAKVSERKISSHSQTIESMTSRLFGLVSFGDDIGLTGFDSQFISAAITHLAGGNIGTGVDRNVTNTDAAIFKLVINNILTHVFDTPEVAQTGVRMDGYELEKAPLMFLLAEQKYALLRVDIKDVEAANLGQFEIAIPVTCMEKISAMELRNSALLDHDTWRVAMSKIARDAPIELDTIVQRMDISLGEILDLKKGDLLDLPNGSLNALSLEGQTPNGPKTIFTGHLGALKTHKAFKIARIPDEEYALF